MKIHVWKFSFLTKSGVGIDAVRTFATQYPDPHLALEHAMRQYKDDIAYFVKFEKVSSMEVV